MHNKHWIITEIYVTQSKNHPKGNTHELIGAAYASWYHGMIQVCKSEISHKTTWHSNVERAISLFLLTKASYAIITRNTHKYTHSLHICINLYFRKNIPRIIFIFYFLPINFSMYVYDSSYFMDCNHFTEHNLGKSALGATNWVIIVLRRIKPVCW